MKKYNVLILIIAISFLLISCTKVEAATGEEPSKTVKVISLIEKESPIELLYTGIVKSETTKNLAFEYPGKITQIYAHEGDVINVGTKLVALDTNDLNLQLNSMQSVINRSLLDVDKSLNSLNYIKDNFSKMETLYKTGAISKQEFDKTHLDLDNAIAQYDQVTNYYKNTFNDYDRLKKKLVDSSIVSDTEGYVLSTFYEEGETISPNMPIMTIASTNQVVTTGLTQKDLSKIAVGQEVIITYNTVDLEGKVSNISRVPDKITRTYEVEISLEKVDSLLLDSIVDVHFVIGNEKGLWIPISSVMSSTVDYVYIVEDNRSIQKTISIESLKGTEVKVSGLNPEDKLVITGMKNLRNGLLVQINE